MAQVCTSADWTGAGATAGCILVLLGIVTVIEKTLNLRKETSRKLVHIAVGHWVLAARHFISVDCPTAAASILGAFVILNAISLQTKMFGTMETSERKTRGTVFYPLALAAITYLYWSASDMDAVVAASMVMAYGDGVAALVGTELGKRAHKLRGNKTIEGSLSFVIAATVATAMTTTGGWPAAFALGLAGSAIEAWTPGDLDNVTVPFAVAMLWSYINKA